MAFRQEVESFLVALGRQQRWQEVLQLLEVKRTGEWPVGHLDVEILIEHLDKS